MDLEAVFEANAAGSMEGMHDDADGGTPSMLRSRWRCAGSVLVPVIAVLTLLTSAAEGQVADRRWEIGGAVGLVYEYPEPLVECGTEVGAASVSILRRVGPHLGLAVSTSVGFDRGGAACPLPGSPQIPVGPGSRMVEDRVDDGLFGAEYVASDLALVFDLTPGDRFGLRLSAGTGRLWTGGLWTGTLAADLSWQTAIGSPFLRVRGRWFRYDFERDLIEYDEELVPVVLETEFIEETATPFLVQVGYRIRVR